MTTMNNANSTMATLVAPPQAHGGKLRERGKYEPFLALLFALIFSGLTYFALYFTMPPRVEKTLADGTTMITTETPPSIFHQKMHFPVGKFKVAQNLDFVITMSTTVLFWWVVGFALTRMMSVSWERRYLNPELLGYGPLDYNMMGALELQLNEYAEAEGESIITRRVRMSIDHIKGCMASKEKPDLPMILDEAAAGDDARVANAYQIPNMLLWAIPIFGFIGTVLGIGAAISEMHIKQKDAPAVTAKAEGADSVKSEVAADSEKDKVDTAKMMDRMAGNLATAFDTTLVALVLAVGGMLLTTLVKRSNQQLLTDAGEFIISNFINRLQLSAGPSTEDQMVKQLYGITQTLERQEGVMRGTMGEMNKSLKEVNENITTMLASSSSQTADTVRDAIMQAFQGFAQTFEEQLGALRVSQEGMNESMLQAIRGLDMNTQAENMNQSMVEAASSLSSVLARYQEDMGKNLGGIIDRQGESTQTMVEMARRQTENLNKISQQMTEMVENGLLLSNLQQTMRENLAVLNQVDDFGLTMRRMEAILDQVYHTLRGFQRPIPLRLQVHQLPPIIMEDDESAAMGGYRGDPEEQAVGALSYPQPRKRKKPAGMQVVPPGGPIVGAGANVDGYADTIMAASSRNQDSNAGGGEPMNTLMDTGDMMADIMSSGAVDAAPVQAPDEPANTLMGGPDLMGGIPAGGIADDPGPAPVQNFDEPANTLMGGPDLMGGMPTGGIADDSSPAPVQNFDKPANTLMDTGGLPGASEPEEIEEPKGQELDGDVSASVPESNEAVSNMDTGDPIAPPVTPIANMPPAAASSAMFLGVDKDSATADTGDIPDDAAGIVSGGEAAPDAPAASDGGSLADEINSAFASTFGDVLDPVSDALQKKDTVSSDETAGGTGSKKSGKKKPRRKPKRKFE